MLLGFGWSKGVLTGTWHRSCIFGMNLHWGLRGSIYALHATFVYYDHVIFQYSSFRVFRCMKGLHEVEQFGWVLLDVIL
jgi:hypothetical protein